MDLENVYDIILESYMEISNIVSIAVCLIGNVNDSLSENNLICAVLFNLPKAFESQIIQF